MLERHTFLPSLLGSKAGDRVRTGCRVWLVLTKEDENTSPSDQKIPLCAEGCGNLFDTSKNFSELPDVAFVVRESAKELRAIAALQRGDPDPGWPHLPRRLLSD